MKKIRFVVNDCFLKWVLFHHWTGFFKKRKYSKFFIDLSLTCNLTSENLLSWLQFLSIDLQDSLKCWKTTVKKGNRWDFYLWFFKFYLFTDSVRNTVQVFISFVSIKIVNGKILTGYFLCFLCKVFCAEFQNLWII